MSILYVSDAERALQTLITQLLAALNQLQANPNDPRTHRQALDAINLANGASA